MLPHLMPERGSQVAQFRGELVIGKESVQAPEPPHALRRGCLRLREHPQ